MVISTAAVSVPVEEAKKLLVVAGVKCPEGTKGVVMGMKVTQDEDIGRVVEAF